NCATIGGANGTQYELSASDDGHTVRFRVAATNADGRVGGASAQTAVVVAAAKPVNTALPAISGTPQENSTLTGANGSWTNSPSKFDTAWLRCDKNGNSCAGISGANKSTYTLGSSDIGNTLR